MKGLVRQNYKFTFMGEMCKNVKNITPDLPFLNIHNSFTNERISVYLDKHRPMSLDTKDYFVKQIVHLSKGVVIVASA